MVIDKPITRSRAKKLQQEVHALLCEVHFNTNENYLLPKWCTLLLLRMIEDEDKNMQKDDYKEEPHSDQVRPAEQSERNSHSFLLTKAMKL